MFEILKQDQNSRARTGVIKTDHGEIQTPAYVIVGTYASVLCLEPEDLPKTKTQLIIANTYHLWRTLGDKGLVDFPGLHEMMQWQGPLMTDSGGFQVFSLGFLRESGMGYSAAKQKDESEHKSMVRITEAGVYFRPDIENSEELYLDAETSIKIQEQLAADIIVAFDEPTAPIADYEYTKSAMQRTHNWAERSLEAKSSAQKIYGVVQGGVYEDLRKESAKFIGGFPFEGIAIGSTYGDAYGGTKAKTADMLEWTIPNLPEHKPRHLFGVGGIEDVLNGVEAGIDTFDCVIPTREARHARLWTSSGPIDIKKGKFDFDDDVIDEACNCPVCAERQISRSQLRKLFKEKNLEAGRLTTIHNVYFFNDLMEKIREAVNENRFLEFKKEYLAKLSDL
jgi:queuine tRNA-ribosyltransferase/7-cyano-7-deazaguanine tRNA-ribosyltransferase